MTLHSYWLFVVSSVALALVPGPDMLYMLARCVAQGRKAGILAALGFNLGGYVHLAAAVLGLSAILATSALAFSMVRWIGAGYLIYLGVNALCSRHRGIAIGGNLAPRDARTIFRQAFLSDVLNPKVALFFLAYLPQFVDSGVPHPAWQILLLGVTVNMICLPINILLVVFSGSITERLRSSSAVANWLQRGMGALFLALGLRIAVEKS
jgi:threonine/homoserine/homoserine lactone efflux protein